MKIVFRKSPAKVQKNGQKTKQLPDFLYIHVMIAARTSAKTIVRQSTAMGT